MAHRRADIGADTHIGPNCTFAKTFWYWLCLPGDLIESRQPLIQFIKTLLGSAPAIG